MSGAPKITRAELREYQRTGRLPERLIDKLAADQQKKREREAVVAKAGHKKDPLKKLLLDLAILKLPAPVAEFEFHPTRGWRFDRAWPKYKIAIEYNGIFGAKNASHASVGKLMRDYRKVTEAQLHGWLVLLVDGASVTKEALDWVERAFRLRGYKCKETTNQNRRGQASPRVRR